MAGVWADNVWAVGAWAAGAWREIAYEAPNNGRTNWIPIEWAARMHRLRGLNYAALVTAAKADITGSRDWTRPTSTGAIRVRVDLVPIPLP